MAKIENLQRLVVDDEDLKWKPYHQKIALKMSFDLLSFYNSVHET
jgi:hypothetical protein